MGRSSKRYSHHNVIHQTSKLKKYHKFASETSLCDLINKKDNLIKQNFKLMIRRLMAKQNKKKSTYLISFLNIVTSCQEINLMNSFACLSGGIPSIENMISQHYIANCQYQKDHHLKPSENLQSYLSMAEPLLSQIVTAQPQLPSYFVCLYQKISKSLNCTKMNKKQHQKVIKGTWNILVKYWKDNDQVLFTDVNEKVQWGLLELLGFKFKVAKKQLFQAEEILRKGIDENEKLYYTNQIELEPERRHFCTLEYIE